MQFQLHKIKPLLIGTMFVCGVLPCIAQSVPEAIDHQGYIEVNGQPFDGQGNFFFAIVDNAGNNIWTHDNSQLGTSNPPDFALTLPVSNGVYSVALGDSNEMTAFPASLFANNADLRLRTWFDDGQNGVQQLTPDKPLQSVPYARVAGTAQSAASVPNVISVDQINYNTPREHVLRLPPPEFVPGSETAPYSLTSDRIFTEGGFELIASIMLPNGATITEMSAVYLDNDLDSDVSFVLRRTNPTGSDLPVAGVNTANESGVTKKTDSQPINNVVDNTQFHYTVTVGDDSNDWSTNPNTTTEVIAVEIRYTLDQAL